MNLTSKSTGYPYDNLKDLINLIDTEADALDSKDADNIMTKLLSDMRYDKPLISKNIYRIGFNVKNTRKVVAICHLSNFAPEDLKPCLFCSLGTNEYIESQYSKSTLFEKLNEINSKLAVGSLIALQDGVYKIMLNYTIYNIKKIKKEQFETILRFLVAIFSTKFDELKKNDIQSN